MPYLGFETWSYAHSILPELSALDYQAQAYYKMSLILFCLLLQEPHRQKSHSRIWASLGENLMIVPLTFICLNFTPCDQDGIYRGKTLSALHTSQKSARISSTLQIQIRSKTIFHVLGGGSTMPFEDLCDIYIPSLTMTSASKLPHLLYQLYLSIFSSFWYLLLLFCVSSSQTQNLELSLYCHDVNHYLWHFCTCGNTSLKRTGFMMSVITPEDNWEATGYAGPGSCMSLTVSSQLPQTTHLGGFPSNIQHAEGATTV